MVFWMIFGFTIQHSHSHNMTRYGVIQNHNHDTTLFNSSRNDCHGRIKNHEKQSNTMMHCISAVATATDVSQTDAKSQVHDLLVSYDPTLREQEVEVQERGGTTDLGTDIPKHLYGRYRFKDAADKPGIISDLESALKNHADVNEFEIAYHQCDHNAAPEDRQGCNPQSEAVSSTAPADSIRLTN